MPASTQASSSMPRRERLTIGYLLLLPLRDSILGVDPGHHGADRELRAVDRREIANGARCRRFHFHHRLSGLHVEQDVALTHAIAGSHVPLGDHAGFHVHVHLRQDHFDRTHQRPPRATRRAAATMTASCGTAAFSSTGLYGMGASAPPSRATGAASACTRSLSATSAAISAPMPIVFTPS